MGAMTSEGGLLGLGGIRGGVAEMLVEDDMTGNEGKNACRQKERGGEGGRA